MPLKGRVGRHKNTGAHCQNWAEDQYAVITLLSLIPTADGGNGGTLATRVVAGIATDALYQAILKFQKTHFPSQVTGFVEPNGPVHAKMQALASRPEAAPPPPGPRGQWNEFKSGSIPKALRAGLADDKQLSHKEVVAIIRSALANGLLSANELSDLQMVAKKAKSILPRSKALLELFVSEAEDKIKNIGPFIAASVRQYYAVKITCDFLERAGSGVWPKLDRDIVGVGILMRIAYPGIISQKNASLCGPAAMVFNVLSDNPGQYAKYAIDIFEKGEGSIRNIKIKPYGPVMHPKGGVFDYRPGSYDIHQTDWLTLASIRNSENWLFDYNDVASDFGGITTPMEMAHWFSRAGYYDVQEDANFVLHRRYTDAMDKASRLYLAGYRVCLLIDSQMVEKPADARVAEPHKVSGSKILMDRHWVVLRSEIIRAGGNVSFTVFTWGSGTHKVPQAGVMTLDQFQMNFFGYVAAKP